MWTEQIICLKPFPTLDRLCRRDGMRVSQMPLVNHLAVTVKCRLDTSHFKTLCHFSEVSASVLHNVICMICSGHDEDDISVADAGSDARCIHPVIAGCYLLQLRLL